MENKNCENIKNCNSCYSCNSCDYCYYCYYCYSCNSCNSCYSCNFCDSCDFCDYCKFSSGLKMSERMIFCLGDGKYISEGNGCQKNYRIFNKEVSKELFDKVYSSQPNFKLPVSVWVDKKDMTDKEKEDKPIYKEIGGYLKVLSYRDAWTEGWKTASKEFKDWVKSLPNFDEKLFTEITGLEIKNDSLSGKKVKIEVDGKSYSATID